MSAGFDVRGSGESDRDAGEADAAVYCAEVGNCGGCGGGGVGCWAGSRRFSAGPDWAAGDRRSSFRGCLWNGRGGPGGGRGAGRRPGDSDGARNAFDVEAGGRLDGGSERELGVVGESSVVGAVYLPRTRRRDRACGEAAAGRTSSDHAGFGSDGAGHNLYCFHRHGRFVGRRGGGLGGGESTEPQGSVVEAR